MPFFRPREYYASVLDIDPVELVSRGFRGVLLDVDNTLMPRTDTEVPAKMADWVRRLQEAGLATLVLSNSFQGGFKRCEELLGLAPAQLVMVGDQTYTDILGANLAGIHSILVLPLGSVDLWHTRVFRVIDKLLLAGLHPKGEFPQDIYTLGER